MGRKQLNKDRGFTLVELIAVVAIISMIAVYITIEINKSSDDAKIGIATAFLTSNVPGAISSYRARNLSSCRGLTNEGIAAMDDSVKIDIDQEDGFTIKDVFVARGLSPRTPWDDKWSVEYDDTSRQIKLNFPVGGDANKSEAIVQDLLKNLGDKSQIESIDTAGYQTTDGAQKGLLAIYNCS